jgi:hypothetical protein
MYWIGYILAFLATIVVGWALPLIGVAIVLPLLQIFYILQPLVAAILMILLGTLLFSYSLYRRAWWQVFLWGFLWWLGALAAALGVFHWYSLFISGILVVFLLIPGVVNPRWVNLLRWYAIGEIGFTLLFLWGQEYNLSGTSLVTASLLLVIASLVGVGAYRPFETRRLRRRIASIATIAAVLIILWNPVLHPAVKWIGNAVGQMSQAIPDSPIGRWYRVVTLRWERLEIGERAKTEAFRQLQPTLIGAHKARWEKATQQIYNLPLAPQEWEDLGIPRQADP